jgi:hypothetical protein
MTAQYVVVETGDDGSLNVWGPFSDSRADAAVNALLESGANHAQAVFLRSSSDLTNELPDWRRVA